MKRFATLSCSFFDSCYALDLRFALLCYRLSFFATNVAVYALYIVLNVQKPMK